MRSKLNEASNLALLLQYGTLNTPLVFYIACGVINRRNKGKTSFFLRIILSINQPKNYSIGPKCSRNIQGFAQIYEQAVLFAYSEIINRPNSSPQFNLERFLREIKTPLT